MVWLDFEWDLNWEIDKKIKEKNKLPNPSPQTARLAKTTDSSDTQIDRRIGQQFAGPSTGGRWPHCDSCRHTTVPFQQPTTAAAPPTPPEFSQQSRDSWNSSSHGDVGRNQRIGDVGSRCGRRRRQSRSPGQRLHGRHPAVHYRCRPALLQTKTPNSAIPQNEMIISPMWKKKRQNLKKKKNFIRKRLPLHTKQQHKNHPALFVTLLFSPVFSFSSGIPSSFLV